MDSMRDCADLGSTLTGPGSPYELRDAEVNGVSCRVYTRAPRTLCDIYLRARAMENAHFLVCGAARMTYRSAFEAAMRLGVKLHEQLRLEPGARVALALRDPLQWVVSFLSLTASGLVPVLIPASTPEAIRRALELASCSMLIAESSVIEHWGGTRWRESKAVACCADLRTGTAHCLEDLVADSQAGSDTDWRRTVLTPDQDALVAFTSGTTRQPKAVLVTHLGLISGLMNMLLGARLAAHSVRAPAPVRPARAPATLLLTPLAHVGGYVQLLLTMLIGGKLIVMPEWQSALAAQMIDNESITTVAGATTPQLLELLRSKGSDSGTLRTVGIHGAGVSMTIVRQIRELWPQVSVATGYGLTETNGTIATIVGDDLYQNPTCCGKVLPTVDVKIVLADRASAAPDISDTPGPPCAPGPSASVAAPGVTGEVWLRGANLMRGYCTPHDPPSGIAAGWFRTGDLGTLSRDRRLSILGRVADLVRVGDCDLLATEVERTVCEEPWVAEAAVLPVQKADAPSALLVAVTARPDHRERLEAVQSRIAARFGLPTTLAKVVLQRDFPRNPSGKIDKAKLRSQWLET